MPKRVKSCKFTSRLWNLKDRQGQAIIEYTLLLIITVSLILALTNLIFKPMGEFISDYFGKYTGCLLEYGELPSIGGDTGSPVDDDSECNKRFQQATWSGGRPPVENSRGSENNNNRNNSNNNNRNASSSDNNSGGGGYAGSNSRGGSSRITPYRRGGASGIENGGGAREGKVVEIALEGGPNNGFFRSSNSGARYSVPQSKTRAIGLTGLTEAEKKRLERKADGSSVTIPTEGARTVAAAKKISVKPPPEKIVIEESEGVTIGNFIRYLFIAALVIALVIFIGGQFLQMSKGGEK